MTVMTTDRKSSIIKKYKRDEHDTGSPEVQVALLTARIQHLTEHLKAHVKDHSSRRGLLALVNKRAKLLKYLERHQRDRYKTLIAELGLRR